MLRDHHGRWERRVRSCTKEGAEGAGEPVSDIDNELGKAKPKKKAPKEGTWGLMNRKVGQDTPRNWIDEPTENFDGMKDIDRKVGVVACFMNSMGTRKNKHLWCVCDRARDGHWVSTQGNHSEHSLAHPNALKDGYAISSTNKQYNKGGKPPTAQARKAAASSSSTGTTLAEADLRIAKSNIDDLHKQIAELFAVRDELHMQLHKSVDFGNQQLSTAARSANETVLAHAREELRATKATTADAIAKMKAMRHTGAPNATCENR